MHTINIVFSSFCHIIIYPVSSGFEEWIHLFVQDSFGQKREILPGAIVIRVEPTNQIVVSTFRHQHTEIRLKSMDIIMAKVTRLFSKRVWRVRD